MRVICAPDKFKLSCTAAQAAHAMAQGVLDAVPSAEVIELPLADGGEGTLDVLKAQFPDRRTARVQDALARPVSAHFALSADGKRALVESAQACGLWRLKEPERNPLKATTFGVGELIGQALDAGATEILIGLGGSATSDGGSGMAAALGARFLDSTNKPIDNTGSELRRARKVDLRALQARVKGVKFSALCDVMTPMLGEQGATRKFVLQKGGTTQSLPRIEEALSALAEAARESGIGLTGIEPGSGAAGGLGYGVAAFLGGDLRAGAAAVLDLIGFNRLTRNTDLVLTGEGSYDDQTGEGKLIAVLGQSCASGRVPLVVLAGTVAPDVHIEGVTAAFGIARYGARRQDNLNSTEGALRAHAAGVARLIAARGTS